VGDARLSRVTRARMGFFVGVLLVAAGLVLTLGLGWALVAAGLGTVAAFVWLYDVSEPEKAVPESHLPFRVRGEDL
jgi:hypothetical protein